MDRFKIYIFEFLLMVSVLLPQVIKLPKGVTWKKNLYKVLLAAWGLFFLFVFYSLIIQFPLFSAISANNMEEVSRIIDKNPSLIKSRKILGQTVLHEAARYGYPEITQYLIDKGANVNSACFSHLTPLHIAVEKDNIEIVDLLLKSSADINARGYRDKFTPLHLAIFNKNIKMAKFLLDHGADPNVKDRSRRTALELAIQKGVSFQLKEEDMGH